jgi:hypothetical protein
MSKAYNGRQAPRVGLDSAQQVSQLNEALRSCEDQLRAADHRLSSIKGEEKEADRKFVLACQQENEAAREKKMGKVRRDK